MNRMLSHSFRPDDAPASAVGPIAWARLVATASALTAGAGARSGAEAVVIDFEVERSRAQGKASAAAGRRGLAKAAGLDPDVAAQPRFAASRELVLAR